MNGRKKLAGQRIAVLATDGFEQVELSVPVTALKAAGAQVDIVSLHGGTIRGVNLNKPARRVDVDRTIDEARARAHLMARRARRHGQRGGHMARPGSGA